MAYHPTADQGSRPGPRWGVCAGCRKGPAAGRPGRGPLALDGKCEPRILKAVRRLIRQIRRSVLATTINPALLTVAERLQYEGYLHREETDASVLTIAKEGASIKVIVRRTGHSRGLVRRILRGERSDVSRVRESSLETYLPWLDREWAAGFHNGADLWRRLRSQEFLGSFRVVTEWASRRGQADLVDTESLHRVPSATTIAKLMTTGRDTLSRAETVTVAAIEAGVPTLVEARTIVEGIHKQRQILFLDRTWPRQPGSVFRHWNCTRSRRGSCRHRHLLVKRADRRADH